MMSVILNKPKTQFTQQNYRLTTRFTFNVASNLSNLFNVDTIKQIEL